MPSTKLLLRVDEPETAAFIARQIGERETLRYEIGMSAAEHGDRFNLHPSRRTEPVVMASEIQRLPKLEGYLCIAGLDRARRQGEALPAAPKADRVHRTVSPENRQRRASKCRRPSASYRS
jgi:hypothetical protein